MHERYKTLGAVLALGEFSVSELAELSGVREPTVRTILRREGTLVEQVGTQSTGRRGGQPARWRLRSEAREQLRAELRELEQLGAGPWLTSQHNRDIARAGIISAEDVLLGLTSSAIDSVERAEFLKLAEAQLDAADVSISADRNAQPSSVDRSLERDKRLVDLLFTLEQIEQETAIRRDRILQEARIQAKEITTGARSFAKKLEREAKQHYSDARAETSTIQAEIIALAHQRDELLEEIGAVSGEWRPSRAAHVASRTADVFDLTTLPSEGYSNDVDFRPRRSAIHDDDRLTDRSPRGGDSPGKTESDRETAEAANHATWATRYLRVAVLLDCVSALAASSLAFLVSFATKGSALPEDLVLSALLPVLWVASVALAGGYDQRVIGVGLNEFHRILNAAVALTAGLAIASYAAAVGFSRDYLVLALPCVACFDLLARYLLRKKLRREQRSGSSMRRAVVVGHAAQVEDLVALLRRDTHHGLCVVAACLVGPQYHDQVADIPTYNGLASVPSVVNRFDAETVAVLASPETNGRRLRELAWDLEKTGTDMYVGSALLDVVGPRTTVRQVAGLPLLHVDRPELAGSRQVVKGVFDRVVAALALIVLLPLFAAIALTIWVMDRGPVFFRQARIGRDGQTFKLWKFRTMVVDAEAREVQQMAHDDSAWGLFKMRRDPRVTRTGAVLRRWSLDELPQLFNVLVGDMSLVGPRPARPDEAAQYGTHMRRRLAVRPGITGLWQVSGRPDLPWDEEARLDERYVEFWSLSLDLQIFWKTLAAVMRGSGVY